MILNKKLNFKIISLIIIIFIGLFFRIIKISNFVMGGQDPWYNIIRSLKVIYDKLNPEYFIHPSLYYYIQAFIYCFYYLITKIFANHLSLLELFLLKEGNFVLLSRFISVTFGIFSLLLIYKIGKELYNEKVGLISCLIFSLLPIHIDSSNQIRVDSVFIFFLLLTFYFICKLYLTNSFKDYILSAIMIGVCTSVNYNGALLFFPWFIALANFIKQNTRNKYAELYLYGAILISICIFFLTSPYIILDFETFKDWFKFQSSLTFNYHPFSEDRKWFYYLFLLFQQSKVFLVSSLISILYFILMGNKKEKFILIFPLMYFIIFTLIKSKYDRFILPSLPFFCLAIGMLYDKIKEKYRIFFILIYFFMLSELFYVNLLNLSVPIPKDNSRTKIFNFLYTNLPPKSTILLESDAMPLLQAVFGSKPTNFQVKLKKAFNKVYPKFKSKIITASFIRYTYGYSPDLINKKKVKYVIVSTENLTYIGKHKEKFPLVIEFYNLLKNEAQIIYTANEFNNQFRVYKIK